MELKFEKTAISCLDAALRDIRCSEQTQEIKLPDGMPDIGRILGAWGQGILRGKEWRSDSISFHGGMLVWVLYAPEDGGEVQCIDGWIPFQMGWDLPENVPEGQIRIQFLPRFVDARNVSPRKIMVRTGVGALAEAFVPKSAEVFAQDAPQQDVELLRSTYPMRLYKEAGEKAFPMEEELTVPDSVPRPEKILYYRMHPKLLDKKVLNSKVVFRGNGNLHVLYRSEEGQLHSWDFDVPFSQFAQLEGEHSADAQADVALSPTSLELEMDDEGHLRLKGGMTAQYVITDKELVQLVEDAYSPRRELEIRTEEFLVPGVLENRRENLYGEQTAQADANIAVDVDFLPDFPRQRRQEGAVELEMPGTFQVLYYGEDGQLHSTSARWEGRHRIPVDDNTALTAVPMAAEVTANPGNRQITMKAEIPLEMTATARQSIPMVTGLDLGEPKQQDPGRPTLVLRRADDSSLWDIAKGAGSTMEAIRKANGLEEDPTPGQMLLIPVP